MKLKIVFILSYILFSCSPKQETGFGPTDKPSQAPASSPEDVSPPSNYSTAQEFFVTLDSTTNYPYYVSQLNSYGSRCAVDKNDVTHRNISCVVDVPELALYFGGIKLAVNVPSGMCEYMTEIPYWYYNEEIGYGPTAIGLEITTQEGVEGQSYRCSVNGSPLSTTCFGYDEAYFKSDSGVLSEKCVYDGTDGGLSNCCLGSYSLTTTNISINASGVATTQTSVEPRKQWGGDVKSCIGGAGRTNWEHYSKSGFPVGKIMETRSGTIYPYTVMAPIVSTNTGSNIPISNYYTSSTPAASSTHYHTGYGALSGQTSTLPYFVTPISDRSGSAVASGSPAYEYKCLDNARELKHSIKLYVREWDTYAAFSSYVSTGVVSGTPWDVTGTEGIDCEGSGDSESCNDYLD